jgi:tripartite-type tricarboxylate transporter receptor subunit TctC
MRAFASLVLALGLALAGPVFGQDYPTKPVRMVVPFAPGGASDLVARIISPGMSQELGQQIVVDNRGGASGNLGVEAAARAAADGYTILLGNIGTMAINPSLFPKFPISPLRDLIAVTQVVDVPTGLVVHPSVPVKTVQEFIDYAKAHPGKLNFGTAGPGSNGRLEMELFMDKTGISLVHVPYKGGAGAAAIALLSGEVQCAFVTQSSVITHVNAGKLIALGPRREEAAERQRRAGGDEQVAGGVRDLHEGREREVGQGHQAGRGGGRVTHGVLEIGILPGDDIGLEVVPEDPSGTAPIPGTIRPGSCRRCASASSCLPASSR